MKALLLVFLLTTFVVAQPNVRNEPPQGGGLSQPQSHNKHYQPNKYSRLSAIEAEEIVFGTNVEHKTNGTANYGLGISWATEVGASIYATPTIIDLYADGHKEIIVPTFTHYLEVIDGQAGDDVKGWPFTHPSLNTHCSVVPVDLDADGTQELMYTSERGELIFLEENGRAMLERTVRIPPLKIRRMWYKLAANADEEHERQLDEMTRKRHEKLGTPMRKWGPEWSRNTHQDAPEVTILKTEGNKNMHRSLQQAPDSIVDAAVEQQHAAGPEGDTLGAGDVNYGDDYEGYGGEEDEEGRERYYGPAPAVPGTDGWLSKEARDSMDLVFHADLFKKAESDAKSLATPEDLLFLRDEMFNKFDNNAAENKDWVFVDAHVLATPVVTDLEMDGSLEAVCAVTYFFDEEFYKKNNWTLPTDVEPSNYLAGGIVVISILTGEVKWSQQLDLSTEHVKYKASIYSSPVVIDIDRDGALEVIVTTAMGFIYVFSSNGAVKKGWPRQMAELQASVLVEDVNGDASLEICAADFQSNVVCFNADGSELWEARVSGGVAQAMVAGDVNADGEVDIVFGTTTGHIWALNGRTGQVVPHFPFKARGRIYAPVLLVRLEGTPSSYGLHIIVMSHDGFLYVVDGQHPSNFEVMDIGEQSFGMTLADDLNGNGMLDLLVTTMNGNVFLIDTKTTWHPLKSWTSFPHALNVVTAREGVGLGVFVSKESRVYRDVVGDHFKIMFHIQDNRPSVTKQQLAPSYHVVIKLGHRLIVHSATYNTAGSYIEFVSTPLQRMYANVVVYLIADSSQVYVDTFSLSFNMHFHTSLKWAFLIPFVVLSVALMFVRDTDSVPDEEELIAEYYRQRMTPEGRVRAAIRIERARQGLSLDSDPLDDDGPSDDDDEGGGGGSHKVLPGDDVAAERI